MNNCIIQGEIINIDKAKFCYYDRLKAVLVINININISCNIYNVMKCRIYDIDIFLHKYALNNICIICGSLKNSKVKFFDYILS
ncbi:MAG: hypothetical protein PHD15_02860 [Clostridia bacterium]|nr:hypothetical protein [Clostridia bacterium]MDD4386685.1 hypothetical protein [Clostridia bacterium]